MASDFSFENPLPVESGTPDVTFTCTTSVPRRYDRTQHPRYTCPYFIDDRETTLSIYAYDDCHIASIDGLVEFYLTPSAITAHLLDPAYLPVVETILLSEIFSLWQEIRGVPMLHASAVVIDGHAVAFLSSSKGGKTGIAAACAREGYKILTDDILPIGNREGRFYGQPGYPALRMWPDQAAYFLDRTGDLPFTRPGYPKLRIPIGPAGFGTFCPDEKSLKVLYVPRRLSGDHGISIVPLSKKEAFFVLLRNSFSMGIVEDLGLEEERMVFFTRMADRVPVRHLSYPEGFNWYPDVVEAVLADLRSNTD